MVLDIQISQTRSQRKNKKPDFPLMFQSNKVNQSDTTINQLLIQYSVKNANVI